MTHKKFVKDSDIVNQLKDSVSVSKQVFEFPSYFHPFNGKQMMISQYYLKNSDIYSFDDRLFFWNKKHDRTGCSPGDSVDPDLEHISEWDRKVSHYSKTIDHCDDIGFDSDFELLDD